MEFIHKDMTCFENIARLQKADMGLICYKGNRPTADLRYGEKDSISPSTPIFAAIKG